MNSAAEQRIVESTPESRLRDIIERYEALCGRYLTMPLGQLHLDIGECLRQIEALKQQLGENCE